MQDQQLWTDVDAYICGQLAAHDEALVACLADSDEAGLPPISITPNQGKMLMILARTIRARRILEIGTLGGYSAIWLARGLDTSHNGAKVVTLEIDPGHAAVAKKSIDRAGCRELVEVMVGPALATLPRTAAEHHEPFDLVFIDADKSAAPEYFAWAVRLTRPGGLIVVDNVVREGEVIDAASNDANVRGIRRLFEVMATDQRTTSTAIQTVGAKGLDGFAIALVTESIT